MEKLEWWGYTQYRRVTYRRTDGQASCHGIVRAMHTRRAIGLKTISIFSRPGLCPLNRQDHVRTAGRRYPGASEYRKSETTLLIDVRLLNTLGSPSLIVDDSCGPVIDQARVVDVNRKTTPRHIQY